MLIQPSALIIVNLAIILRYLPVKLFHVIQRYQVSRRTNNTRLHQGPIKIRRIRLRHHRLCSFLRTNNIWSIFPKSMKCQSKQAVWNDSFRAVR
jgi:hypothetical protein